MSTHSPKETMQLRMANQQRQLYVRLKRKRDEVPPPFLCILPRKRRNVQGSRNGGSAGGDGGEADNGCPSSLSMAIILKHVDSAPAPEDFGCVERHSGCNDASSNDASTTTDTQPPVDSIGASVAHALGLHDINQHIPPASSSEADNRPVAAGDSEASHDVDGATFWKAFNAPIRRSVFGSDTPLGFRHMCSEEPDASSASHLSKTCYHSLVEDAVKSVRRFKLSGAGRSLARDEVDTDKSVGTSVLLASGEVVEVIDVSCDNQGTAFSDAGDGEHFEYDLYAADLPEGQENDGNGWGKSSRVVELLQQDCVGLVEIEDIDENTGVVSRGYHSMQAFLNEFGDIDDSCSGRFGDVLIDSDS